jgi:hypothetical protein
VTDVSFILVESRYQSVINRYQQGEETIKELGSRHGVCCSVIKTALLRARNPIPFFRPGRPPMLFQVHKELVRLRTVARKNTPNTALAQQLSRAFPDLGTICETVIGKYRKELELF